MTREYVYTPPWMPEELHAALFAPERTVIIEGASKCGKTTGCMLWLAELAFETGRPGRNFWWVSSVYGTAEIAYARLKQGLPPAIIKARDDKMSLTLPNGAIIGFRSAEKPDNLYGADVYAAVGDEVSRWREAAWHALRTTLTATKGPVRLVHNVKGRQNFAYKLARRAEAGEPDMLHRKFTAWDAVRWGLLEAKDVEDAQRLLPEAVFKELYLCQPSDDGGNPFGFAAIRAGIAPLSGLKPTVWGVDLARAVDWTVAIALDEYGDVCAFERWQAPWPETEERLAQLIGSTPALVDSTGVGDPVLAHLQRLVPKAEGFTFSAPSKQKLMEGLAVAIQQGEVHYPEGPIVAELETFEYEHSRTGVRYSAPAGLHDDCVAALALAVQLVTEEKQRPVPQPFRIAVSAPRQAPRNPYAPYQPPSDRII